MQSNKESRKFLAIRQGGRLVAAALLTIACIIPTSLLAQTQLLSKRNPGAAAAPDFQDSVSPSISGDGRFVLFVSTAKNLVSGDNGYIGANLFLRDRLSNSTVLVTLNTNGPGGGNGQFAGVLSTNGRYVLFETTGTDHGTNVVANGVNDIYVRDLVAGTTTLVDVSTNGGLADGRCSDAVITPDGRYVAFLSYADNLVPSYTNALPGVFVRDLVAQTTSLVSVGAFFQSTPPSTQIIMATPLISADGRYLAFFSSAQGLVPGMTNFPGDIFVRDLVAGTTTWVSSNLSSTQIPSNAPSFHPAMSSDGRFIAFKYGQTNTSTNSPGPTIFLYDSTTGSNTVIATNVYAVGGADADDAYGPVITPDGRYIAYVTNVTGFTPNHSAICIYDTQTGSNTLASVDPVGNLPNALSDTPVLTPDGRYLAFVSTANNLADGASSATGLFLYLRDLVAGTNRLVSVGTNTVSSPILEGFVPSLSADGRYVAFSAAGGGVIPNDTFQNFEVFVRDMTNQITELISQRNPAVSSQSASAFSYMSQASLSQDGRRLAYTSFASNLVTNDFNNTPDVFVRDLQAGSNILVSIGNTGNAADGGPSYNPLISANGRYVAFLSSATNLLVSNSTTPAVNLYLRDLDTGSTILVNPAPPPAFFIADALSPAMSQDGRYLAYLYRSNSTYFVFRYDALTGQTNAVAANVSSSNAPSISANGRYVAYANPSATIFVWDSQANTNIFSTNVSAGLSTLAVSPTGTRLALQFPKLLTIFDFATRSNLFFYSGSNSMPTLANSAIWSTDARFIVFATPPDFLLTNKSQGIYLRDLQNSNTVLVSGRFNSTVTNANGFGDQPAMSGDGRFVIYRHTALDVVALPSTNAPNIFIYDRFTGSNSLLTTSSANSSWSFWRSTPAISGDGRVTGFSSFNSDSSEVDLNRTLDIFASNFTPWGTTDTDGDGIPDSWMVHYFGHATGQAGDHSRATDDADGDGMTNLQEFLAGTDPNNAASVLRLQLTPVVSQNSIQLNWTAIPGKAYKIQYKANLTDPSWTDASTSVNIAGFQASFAVPTDQPGRYYRAVVTN